MAGEQQVSRRFRVGIVVLIALVATMIGIFMIGQRANLFRSKFPYETHFESASGLIAGNNVSLNGVVVGSVIEVRLSGDPADRTVRVIYDVVKRWAPSFATTLASPIRPCFAVTYGALSSDASFECTDPM